MSRSNLHSSSSSSSSASSSILYRSVRSRANRGPVHSSSLYLFLLIRGDIDIPCLWQKTPNGDGPVQRQTVSCLHDGKLENQLTVEETGIKRRSSLGRKIAIKKGERKTRQHLDR